METEQKKQVSRGSFLDTVLELSHERIMGWSPEKYTHFLILEPNKT